VHAKLDDELSLEQMAEAAQLGRTRFSQMFRKSTGQSPHQFVLSHRVERGIVNGKEDWIRCETGSTMILPPNSLHSFYNRSAEPCRMLGISTQLHQAFFDAVASADQKEHLRISPETQLGTLLGH
jgi:hypothetical protein